MFSKPRLVADAGSGLARAALRPSEYTAALIQVLRCRADLVKGANVLEIGSGSGVVLAALGELGASSLCGIDIEEDAVSCGILLLDGLGHGELAEFHQGDMWQPVGERRFDLVVANLPHYPMTDAEVPGRLTTWSAGGPDGRRLLDRFLQGLIHHLAPAGRAFITHNAFVGVERSRSLTAAAGLTFQIVYTALVNVPSDKLAHMTRSVLAAAQGHSIHCYGPYAFAEVHIVEMARQGTSI